MASNSEYEQRRSFEDEYPKRFTKDGKNFVTVRDGFGGFCTFIPIPSHSNDTSYITAKVEFVENRVYDAETQWKEEYNIALKKAAENYRNSKI